MQALQAFTLQPIKAGKTLIFIDEIQEAHRGLDSLKYFCENARDQHIVVAGSLLGVTHRPGESYPVGKVDLLYLYPMSFEEFLWAKGEEQLAEMIAHCDWELMGILDTRIQELLRQYYYVGGMPEAVLNCCLCKCLHKPAYVKSHIMSSSATNNKKCYCESKRCA